MIIPVSIRAEAELTRSIKQIQVAANSEPPQLFGHAWFWCTLTHSSTQKPVDQSGLADIGEANDCCPDGAGLQASGLASVVDAVAQ